MALVALNKELLTSQYILKQDVVYVADFLSQMSQCLQKSSTFITSELERWIEEYILVNDILAIIERIQSTYPHGTCKEEYAHRAIKNIAQFMPYLRSVRKRANLLQKRSFLEVEVTLHELARLLASLFYVAGRKVKEVKFPETKTKHLKKNKLLSIKQTVTALRDNNLFTKLKCEMKEQAAYLQTCKASARLRKYTVIDKLISEYYRVFVGRYLVGNGRNIRLPVPAKLWAKNWTKDYRKYIGEVYSDLLYLYSRLCYVNKENEAMKPSLLFSLGKKYLVLGTQLAKQDYFSHKQADIQLICWQVITNGFSARKQSSIVSAINALYKSFNKSFVLGKQIGYPIIALEKACVKKVLPRSEKDVLSQLSDVFDMLHRAPFQLEMYSRFFHNIISQNNTSFESIHKLTIRIATTLVHFNRNEHIEKVVDAFPPRVEFAVLFQKWDEKKREILYTILKNDFIQCYGNSNVRDFLSSLNIGSSNFLIQKSPDEINQDFIRVHKALLEGFPSHRIITSYLYFVRYYGDFIEYISVKEQQKASGALTRDLREIRHVVLSLYQKMNVQEQTHGSLLNSLSSCARLSNEIYKNFGYYANGAWVRGFDIPETITSSNELAYGFVALLKKTELLYSQLILLTTTLRVFWGKVGKYLYSINELYVMDPNSREYKHLKNIERSLDEYTFFSQQIKQEHNAIIKLLRLANKYFGDVFTAKQVHELGL